MEDALEAAQKTSDGSQLALRTFLSHLKEPKQEEFQAILEHVGDEFPDISPLQRGQMAMALMIQEHIVGKGFAAVLEDKDLSKTERDFLDWSRKNYENNVNRIYDKRKRANDRSSVPEILARWQEEGKITGDIEKEFEKIPAEELPSGEIADDGEDDGEKSASAENFRKFREDIEEDDEDRGERPPDFLFG